MKHISKNISISIEKVLNKENKQGQADELLKLIGLKSAL